MPLLEVVTPAVVYAEALAFAASGPIVAFTFVLAVTDEEPSDLITAVTLPPPLKTPLVTLTPTTALKSPSVFFSTSIFPFIGPTGMFTVVDTAVSLDVVFFITALQLTLLLPV